MGGHARRRQFSVGATLGRTGGSDSKIVSENALVYRFDGDRIAEWWMLLGVLPQTAEAFFAA